MIEVPQAKLYVLLPVEAPKEVVTIGDVRPCGDGGITFSQLLMNEMALLMTPDDVVGVAGLNLERCMIIVNFSKEHAEGLLDGATMSVDELFKKKPDLIPEGGAFMIKDLE